MQNKAQAFIWLAVDAAKEMVSPAATRYHLNQALYHLVWHGIVWCGVAQHSTAQHSTAQHSTAQHSTAQHSTAQHSTAQHSTAQHSPLQLGLLLPLSLQFKLLLPLM